MSLPTVTQTDALPREVFSSEKPPSTSEHSSSSDHAVDTKEESEYPTGWRLWAILTGIIASCVLTALDLAIIGTAIPAITNRFHSTSDIGWYAAAYMLSLAALQPLSGKIVAAFPVKPTFLAFCLIFQLGSLICGAAVSSNMFIVGRAIAGAGAAGIYTGGLAIVRSIAPLDKSTFYTSLIVSFFGIGTIIGPVIGGALTEHVTWRWCFYINLPIGAVTFAALILVFDPPEHRSAAAIGPTTIMQKFKGLDLVGFFFFVPTIIMLLLALEWGGHQFAWRSATIIGLFVGFAGMLAVFLSWEYHKGDDAMIPFSLYRRRAIVASSVYSFFLMVGMSLCNYYLPEFFQIILNKTPAKSGVLMLPGLGAQVAATIFGGIVVSRTGYFNQFAVIGPAFLSVAMGLYTTLSATSRARFYTPLQVVQGLGIGVAFQVSIIVVQVEMNDNPVLVQVATGLAMFWTYLGAAIGTSVALTVFQNDIISGLREKGLPEDEVKRLLVAGATGARRLVEKEMPDLVGTVVGVYARAIGNVFWIGVAAAIFTTIAGALLPIRNVKKVAEAAAAKKKALRGEVVAKDEER